MKLARPLLGILLCLSVVACGDSSKESPICLDGEPCSKAIHELAVEPNNTFEENHGIIPDVTPADLQRQVDVDLEAVCNKFALDAAFNNDPDIIPDVTPDLVRNLTDDEETDTASSTIEDEIVAECSAASEEVIQDCERAERSTERCELRGLWVYSGCKLELIQSRLNAE